ncbi:hypothetical protein B0F90DRAFT_860571 [Multifurca ochricompacta]|uniref:Uncharacterized protein n=1 Tax=Multifurca ochricompacta TaxID=376703 RepID=A0AAD4M2E1_9AGAM|nr:hypothetical protein B0F90DRAFT_860571 [Multifurca ochricompacta]
MTIAWGQNAANGELGSGPEEPKSLTKPQRNQPLIGIDVFDVAAGQNTTFFLVTPNEKYSDLPRHPFELDTPDVCMICHKDDGDPLACDKPPSQMVNGSAQSVYVIRVHRLAVLLRPRWMRLILAMVMIIMILMTMMMMMTVTMTKTMTTTTTKTMTTTTTTMAIMMMTKTRKTKMKTKTLGGSVRRLRMRSGGQRQSGKSDNQKKKNYIVTQPPKTESTYK